MTKLHRFTDATPGGPKERLRKDFASRLSLMKEEAGRLGLFATMHRMDVPLVMVGFEISGNIEAGVRYEQDREAKKK